MVFEFRYLLGIFKCYNFKTVELPNSSTIHGFTFVEIISVHIHTYVGVGWGGGVLNIDFSLGADLLVAFCLPLAHPA